MGVIAEWRTEQERRGHMPSSVRRRTDQVRSFARWLDDHGRTLATATENDVQRFLDAKRIGARTRYGYLSTLGCFYRWARRAGYTLDDPTENIVRPKLRRTLPRPVSDGDLAMALQLAPPMMRRWLVLAAYAGMRCAEIAGLQRDDVLWDAEVLHVVGKGGRERLVPMHPLVVDELRSWPMPRMNGPVFTRPQGGPWPPARLSRVASEYLHACGIDATMHQLRHWFGTRTYAATKDVRVVQELLGHSSPTTTAIYTAFSAADARRAVLGLRYLDDPREVTTTD